MKKVFLFILILCLSLGLCACKRQSTMIIFNEYPITKDNLLQNSTVFTADKKFYFVVISTEKPISESGIRIRIVKKEEKANFAMGKVVYSNDFRLKKGEVYYYTDGLTMGEAGYYCMFVYAKDRLDRPLAIADFRIKK